MFHHQKVSTYEMFGYILGRIFGYILSATQRAAGGAPMLPAIFSFQKVQNISVIWTYNRGRVSGAQSLSTAWSQGSSRQPFSF